MAAGKRKEHGEQFRAAAVAEARAGCTREVAKARGISLRTLQRWMVEAKTSPDMARDVARKSELIERDWAEDAKRTIRVILGGVETLVARAVAATENGEVPPGRIHEVAGALKIVGELGVAKELFGGRSAEDDRENRPTATSTRQADDIPRVEGHPIN